MPWSFWLCFIWVHGHKKTLNGYPRFAHNVYDQYGALHILFLYKKRKSWWENNKKLLYKIMRNLWCLIITYHFFVTFVVPYYQSYCKMKVMPSIFCFVFRKRSHLALVLCHRRHSLHSLCHVSMQQEPPMCKAGIYFIQIKCDKMLKTHAPSQIDISYIVLALQIIWRSLCCIVYCCICINCEGPESKKLYGNFCKLDWKKIFND